MCYGKDESYRLKTSDYDYVTFCSYAFVVIVKKKNTVDTVDLLMLIRMGKVLLDIFIHQLYEEEDKT